MSLRPRPKPPAPVSTTLTDLQEKLVRLVTEYELMANEMLEKVEAGTVEELDATWKSQLFLPCVDNICTLEQYVPCYLANATRLEADYTVDMKNAKNYADQIYAYHYGDVAKKYEDEGKKYTETHMKAVISAIPEVIEAQAAAVRAEGELLRIKGYLRSIDGVMAVLPGIQGKRNRTLDAQ